jgi:hypothetical protein
MLIYVDICGHMNIISMYIHIITNDTDNSNKNIKFMIRIIYSYLGVATSWDEKTAA